MTAPLLRVDPVRLQPALVDTYVHLSADGGPGLPAEQWPALAQEAGVRTAAVFPTVRPGYRQANEALLAFAAGTPSIKPFARLGGRVPVTSPQLWQLRSAARSRVGSRAPDLGAPADLARYAGAMTVPHVDGVPAPELLAELGRLGRPLVVHCGEHAPVELVERELVERTTGPVILAHLGAFPASAPHLAAALDLVRRHDRVFLETSASWLAEFVAIAARAAPDKLLFGSGTPLMHPQVAWRHVAAAIVDDDVAVAVAHGNAERVLGW